MLGYTDHIVSHCDLISRLSAFGWDCTSVDGHDVNALQATLQKQKRSLTKRPKALIAKTLKGHGVPSLENLPLCHVMNPKPEVIDSLLSKGQ